jgi:branched-chain amino acid transport system permease protein
MNVTVLRRWGPPVVGVAMLIVYPLVLPLILPANPARFWTLSIGAQSLILGIVALSMVFMSGYGGMISLAQAALAGFAAYMVALAALSPSTTAVGANIGLGLPAIPSALIALVLSTALGALFGAISSRSSGIYFLMLTLALAVGFFYVVLQNYDIFGGHIGFAGIIGPTGQPRQNPVVFYYLCLAAAALVYLGLRYLVRSQLGLTFRGIRDNPRRMQALGYWVSLHKVVLFAIGGFVAGVSGVLGVWYRGNVSPGIVDLTRTIDVLIIAVVGGLNYPMGAFVGAVFFVLIDVFASSVKIFGFSFDQRFNTLIGLGFVVVVLVAPNGLVGLADQAWQAIRRRVAPAPPTAPASPPARPPSTESAPLLTEEVSPDPGSAPSIPDRPTGDTQSAPRTEEEEESAASGSVTRREARLSADQGMRRSS